MIAHQAIGMTDPIVCPNNITEYLQKCEPIRIIFIDSFPSVATGSDMVQRIFELDSYGSCHAENDKRQQASILDLTPICCFFSANVMPRINTNPDDADLLNLLQPLIDEGRLVKVIDEQGNTLIEFLGNWQNQIGDLLETEGYQIKVTGDATLALAGIPTELPLAIPVSAGWNMVSYPAQTPQNALDTVQPLIDEGSLVKIVDERGRTIVNFLGNWVNQIGNVEPGEGYKLKVAQNTTLTIDEAPEGVAGALHASAPALHRMAGPPTRGVEQTAPAHFTPVWSGNPYPRFNTPSEI